ncbi:MAG: PHP domain-containing protein [Syntrophorhabdaceae bacterium]|nr:PHP domain-containing protein [Syntrophorhabdaceae bacterium]
MLNFSCDLHIHSTLSPCASLDMSPKNIVLRTKEIGLDIIAITDHNMVENALYAREIGKTEDVHVLIGMELQTKEEIHLLAIFDSPDTGMEFQRIVYDLLPPVPNRVEYFGDQLVVNGDGEIVRVEERLLINSAGISIEDAVSWIASRGGIAIPSHIDSPSFSILSQIGYIPEDIPFDALEVRNEKSIDGILSFITKGRLPIVTFSDAHYIEDIGRKRTILNLEEPNCSGIKRALKAMREMDFLS